MEFTPIRDGNGNVSGWYAVDPITNFVVTVWNCTDRSGLVAHIIDAYSGEKVRDFYASALPNVKSYITNWLNSAATDRILATL